MKLNKEQMKKCILVAVIAAAYVLLYLGMRHEKFLIHRMSYSGYGMTSFRHHHWIENAENDSRFQDILSKGLYFACSPLRWLEAAFWYCYPRTYYLRTGFIAEGNEIREPNPDQSEL